jgi:hypothetical protein
VLLCGRRGEGRRGGEGEKDRDEVIFDEKKMLRKTKR